MVTGGNGQPQNQEGGLKSAGRRIAAYARRFCAPVLHKPNLFTWITIITNTFVLLSALLVPLLYNSGQVNQWFAEWGIWANKTPDPTSQQSIWVAVMWLIATNVTSMVSLALVNTQSSNNTIRDSNLDDDELQDANKIAKRVNTKMRIVWLFTGLVILMLFGVILTLWIRGPKEEIMRAAIILSSLGYMALVTLSDFIGSSALEDCQEIMNLVETKCSTAQIKTRLLAMLRRTEEDLAFFRRVILFVDFPILLGLIVITIQEYAILIESPFRAGFTTGAIAMHIVIANLVSIVLSMFKFKESQI